MSSNEPCLRTFAERLCPAMTTRGFINTARRATTWVAVSTMPWPRYTP